MSFGLKSRVRFPTAMNPCVGDIRHVLGSNHRRFFNVVIKSGPCERGKCMVVAMGEDEVKGRSRGRQNGSARSVGWEGGGRKIELWEGVC
jgi:hypothetical protein